MRFQKIRKNVLLNAFLHGLVYRLSDGLSLFLITPDLINQDGILPQGCAFRHQFRVVTVVNVVYFGCHLHTAARLLKSVTQTKCPVVRRLVLSIVENDVMRRGNLLQLLPVYIEVIPVHIAFQQSRQIDKSSQRHVRVQCTLVFIKIDIRAEQERNVILHSHVDDILNKDNAFSLDSPKSFRMTLSFREFERGVNAERRPLVDEWEMNLAIIDGQIENAKKAVIKAKREEQEQLRENLRSLQERKRNLEENEEKPLQLFCGDATPEALIDLLSKNNGRMALISDEGGVLDTVAGARYSDRTNLDGLLNAYSGSPIRINRRTRESETVDRPALTIAVMVQPITLQGMIENGELMGRGLLARFLFSFPRSKVGHRKYDTFPVPSDVINDYRELLRGLLSLYDE